MQYTFKCLKKVNRLCVFIVVRCTRIKAPVIARVCFPLITWCFAGVVFQGMLPIDYDYVMFCRCCFPSQHQRWAGDYLRALQLPDPCRPQRRRGQSRTAASHRQVLLPRSVHRDSVGVVCVPLSLLDLKWNRTEGASCCLSATIFVNSFKMPQNGALSACRCTVFAHLK